MAVHIAPIRDVRYAAAELICRTSSFSTEIQGLREGLPEAGILLAIRRCVSTQILTSIRHILYIALLREGQQMAIRLTNCSASERLTR